MADDTLRTTKIKATNFKCFGDIPEGFDAVLPINVIIGRNNSGKSTLLDLISCAVNTTQSLVPFYRAGRPAAKVVITAPLKAQELASVFQSGSYTSDVGDHTSYARQLIGRQISWTYESGNRRFHSVDSEGIALAERHRYETALANKPNPFQNRRFRRLSAERNIAPEGLNHGADPNVAPDGRGATETLLHFLTHSKRDKLVITDILLGDLNAIFGDDATFTDLDTLEIGTNQWEVFLNEREKGRIKLSQSGSGLKTVILILIYIHLVPQLEGASLDTFIFGFEEPENNLHPAVQRRLLRFLRNVVEEHRCTILITTHSAVEIDFFARDELAQVLHVTHDGGTSHVTTVSSHATRRFVLDDLDIRASDILQSNGIIWVEGPSDRIYVNKWIELWTGGALREGAHYQVLHYGGKLLAHLDSTPPEQDTETIHILTTNRNAAIVIDSDKRTADGAINATKQRLVEEVTSASGFAWVTEGREIENYIPMDVLTRVAEFKDLPGQFEAVRELILANDTNKRQFGDKVTLAQLVVPLLTREHLAAHLDLAT